MLIDTYGCTRDPIEYCFKDTQASYDYAVEKAVIETADMSNCDEEITREDFYTLLAKTIYASFMHGGYVTFEDRYINRLKERIN